MGQLSVIRSSPLATVQDQGRFGFRKYGIPQSGAIDMEGLRIANQLVGNEKTAPAIEFALGGLKLEALKSTTVGVFGAAMTINNMHTVSSAAHLDKGDVIELTPPKLVYAYLAIGGKLAIEDAFESKSTYLPGKFGGLEGRVLRQGDVLKAEGKSKPLQQVKSRSAPGSTIHFMKGPEWPWLEKTFFPRKFEVASSSNRIGIRLIGEPLTCHTPEIRSSAVIPGTIQLPPNGQPIVLMNDCQTMGGYPRIGKVVNEDLGDLGQLKPNAKVNLIPIET